jgi:oxygen-independent coproporphyrinogen-3 oxidase
LPSPVGLYLHIPFCSAICGYCNFNRGLLDEALKRRYVEALAGDIRARTLGDRAPADTIFFGGGTPSLLDPSEVSAILSACRESFDVDADAEVTLEANPETLTAESLSGFVDAGITRLSLGVQSFRDEELKRLGRIHSAKRAVEAFAMARSAGFSNISLDLMMWLPGQSVSQWLESVDALIALAPEHGSLYILELYPNSPLREDMARADWSLAPDDDAAGMYLDAMERLDRAGYEQYEISNVARPGFRSRHNLKYWTDQEWLGFGCGAHSTSAGTRWQNVADPREYVDRISNGLSPVAGRRVLTAAEHVEEALFTGLRLADGIDLDEVRVRHGVDVPARYGRELAPYVQAGLVETNGRRLRLTRRGMLVANEVMTIFVDAAVR